MLEKLIADTDALTDDFIKYFANLTSQQLNNRKSTDQWTIAQCFQHVILVNESYLPLITAVKEKRNTTSWYAKISLVVNYFGNNALQLVKNTDQKLKTAPQWQPDTINPVDDIVINFVAHQQQLKQLFATSEDLIKSKSVIHSPVNKMIAYKVADVFKILVAHEERHLRQAKVALALQYSEKMIL